VTEALTEPAAAPYRRRPRRWWLFRPLDLAARLWPIRRERQGVLVVRIDGIGDMVLFQGAFRHYPEALGVAPADITVLGCESWASLAGEVYPGCRFRAIDEHAYERRPLYRFKVSLWVRRQGFAVAICDSFLRRPLVGDSLVYASGAPYRIVAKPWTSPKTQGAFDWYLARCRRVVDTGPYPTHEIIRHFRFVSALGGRPVRPEAPVLHWPASPRPLEARYAVLNIGSNEPGRRWPLASFLALAEHLARRGLAVVFVGGRAEAGLRPAVAAAATAAGSRGGAFIDRIAATTLPELLDLQQHAELVVSSDTGPAHLAIALGTPTIVLVGGGHFTSFVPYPAELTGKRVRFVWRELACYHCFWLCTQPHRAGDSYPCLQTVTVARVCDAADELLAARPPERGSDR
jgi:ADP-heptose:LPS heptosyltransferase